MSETTKVCPAQPGADTYIKAYQECNGTNVLISLDSINTDRSQLAVCDVVATCPTITNLQNDLASVNNKITIINTNITNLDNQDNALQANIDAVNGRVDTNDGQIDEINKNITMIKGWNVRQDAAIKALGTRVIKDTSYLNFQERVENKYIPQCDQLTNRYSRGDIYINVNQRIDATNATYINTRDPQSTAPCSASDRQEVLYSSPADVLAFIGIDPIDVTHPYKHERVASLNPTKFQDFMAQLQHLDLSNVEVSLGEVYFDPIFKESAIIQENLTVGGKITSPQIEATTHLEAQDFHATTGCIDTITCPVTFQEDVTFNQNIAVQNTATLATASVTNGTITNLVTNTAVLPTITGNSNFTDSVSIGQNLDVTAVATITTANITTGTVDDLTTTTAKLPLVTGASTFASSVTMNENLSVANTVTAGQDLVAPQAAHIQDAHVVTLSTNHIESENNTTINIDDQVNFSEGINVSQTVQATNLNVSAGAVINNANLTGTTQIPVISGNVSIAGGLTAQGALVVNGPANLNGQTQVDDLHARHAALPGSGEITINGVNLEDRLVAFIVAHGWNH